jgi:hypothetical protein
LRYNRFFLKFDLTLQGGQSMSGWIEAAVDAALAAG